MTMPDFVTIDTSRDCLIDFPRRKLAVVDAFPIDSGAADMNQSTRVQMEEVTDPIELAQARAQREQFDRNSAWLQAHASEIYPTHRGKCICVAGEELFVAETAREAVALANAAHPQDRGRFVHYIPIEKVLRIYAHQR